MFATVVLDPITVLIFGSALALASFRQLAREPATEVARTGMIGAAWGAFYAVCVGWMYFHYPDWMFAYLKDARTVSLWPSYIVFLLLLAGFGAGGALAASALLSNKKPGWALVLFAGLLVAQGAAFWLQWRQYAQIGTLDEFLQGHARPLADPGDAKVPMTLTAVFAAGTALPLLAWRVIRGRA